MYHNSRKMPFHLTEFWQIRSGYLKFARRNTINYRLCICRILILTKVLRPVLAEGETDDP